MEYPPILVEYTSSIRVHFPASDVSLAECMFCVCALVVVAAVPRVGGRGRNILLVGIVVVGCWLLVVGCGLWVVGCWLWVVVVVVVVVDDLM